MAEDLLKLALEESQAHNIVRVARLDQTEHTPKLLCDYHAALLVQVVVRGHVKVNDIVDVFDQGALRVPSVEHHDDIILANIEEVKD